MLIQQRKDNLNNVWFHQQHHFDVHKEHTAWEQMAMAMDEGLEAASRKILLCREADGGQSSRSALY